MKSRKAAPRMTEDQLNVIFDYITQQNQIDSIEQVSLCRSRSKEAPAPAPAQQAKPAAPARTAQARNPPRPQSGQNPAAPAAAGECAASAAELASARRSLGRAARIRSACSRLLPQLAAKQPQPERKRERRVIDTSAVTVNADRYDDRVDSLVSDRVGNYSSGKQKIGSKNKSSSRLRFGTKSRSEEQRNAPPPANRQKGAAGRQDPDEITVGELASRMKRRWPRSSAPA